MKVAFDGAPLAERWLTGVGRSFLDALGEYARGAAVPPVLLLPDGVPPPVLTGVDVHRAPRGAWRRQFELPRLLRRLGADVLHSPVAAVPLWSPCPAIATVHDLPWLCPGSGERATLRQRLATTCSLRAARAVLAPSGFTLAAARRLLPRHPRLLCVPHGTRTPAAPPCDPTARNGPLLVLGDDRPRKNRGTVRRAHALARQRCPGLPELCFVGPPGNYVDEHDKERLLGSCRALVQCSRFEGFGLPVLEGLAHGVPVVCSELEPFREIAGDAALFVPPLDAERIAAALLRVHEDTVLRARLSAAGPARAARFSLAAVAAAWRQLHEDLVR